MLSVQEVLWLEFQALLKKLAETLLDPCNKSFNSYAYWLVGCQFKEWVVA
jgi:hypothetical protein